MSRALDGTTPPAKNSTDRLVIIGDGEFAQIAYEYFTFDSSFEVVAFAVERQYLNRESLFDLPVISFEQLVERYPPGTVKVHVAVTYTGLNSVRMRLFQNLKEMGYQFANYISARAFVWKNVKLGENVFIFENNVVQHFCEIGNGVVLWSGNHIGHRTVLEDGVYISSHVVVSGYCRIGARSFVGVNAGFADHVNIGEDCFVAMGSNVVRSLSEPNKVIKGAPATPGDKVSAKRYFKIE